MTVQDQPTIQVTGGRISGIRRAGAFCFLGVPYAAPIAGLDRWRPPQPVREWAGVRDASQYGEACPQPSIQGFDAFVIRQMPRANAFIEAIVPRGLKKGDDCLNLNVWTPTLDPDARLPVMVWIHGGSFVAGSGAAHHYDGTHFASKGVVVVTINYRLNVWGYFGGEGLFPGDVGGLNRGHLDQTEALRWIRDNIRSFGGNPDCVTVAGESAGATSAIALLSSPATVGLFHRVICMSGAAISDFPQEEVSRYSSDWLREVHGVRPGDSEALANLGVRNVLTTMKGIGKFLSKRRDRYGSLGKANFTQMHMATGTEFLPDKPLDYMKLGRRRGVDLMIGTCKDEARLWTIGLPFPDRIAARIYFRAHAGVMNPWNRPEVTFRNYKEAMKGAPDVLVYERAMTDALFRKWSLQFADAHASVDPGRTWWYRFDWESPAVGGGLGAIHVMDVPGFFQNYVAFNDMVGSEAAARPAGDALHEAAVSFIKTGNPNNPGQPIWAPYSNATKPCMIFDTRCRLEHDLDSVFEKIW